MKLKKQNTDRLDLTLDYLIDMTFDSHNYKNWDDVPMEHRSSISLLRKLIGETNKDEVVQWHQYKQWKNILDHLMMKNY